MALRAIWRRRKAAASTATVSAFSTAAVVLAIAYPGTPTAQVQLNDGGVWVTNAALSLVGHLNFQAGELDSGLRATSNDFDVLQHGDSVLLADTGSATASPVDVADVRLKGNGHLPAGATMQLGGPTVAVVAADAKKLWVLDADQVASFDQQETRPTATFTGRAAVTVGQDGTVWAAVASTGVLDRYGPGGAATSQSLPGIPVDSTLQATTVGTHVVVLDATKGTVSVDGGNPVTVAGAAKGAVQQPGADAADVEVAGPDALLDVPLDGSAPTAHPAGKAGTPTAPVRLNGCTYAAWAGSARYLRDCDGTASDVARDIPNAGDGTYRFRVNRDVVVLNDVTTGGVWLTNDALTQVNNWQDVTPKDDKADDQQQATDAQQNQLGDRHQQNRPPVAVDDHFGVRPGRTTILPVLANDSDPDGDVLTAAAKTQPSFGTLQSIRDDEAFQLAVPADASGSTSFQYTASDGRGGTADANVTVEVHGAGVESPPVQDRVMTLVVGQGKSAKINVLPGWSDPDGDDLFLQSASITNGDQVTFTPDGQVTVTDVGTSTVPTKVTLVVSDNQKTTEGTLTVQILAGSDQPPVANADHVSTVVGRPVTVHPLDNDTDPNGDELRLAKVDDTPGLTLTKDFTAGTFTATATVAASYYVTYTVTDGPQAATGLVRIDVTAPPSATAPPIAVRDTGLLPTGGTVYVDPLANDVDPAGGILVVQGVTLPADSPLTVAVIDHHLLRISAQSALSGPVAFDYTVSDGAQQATGEVVVMPVPAPATIQPPVAKDDTATVRVGDVVSIPVLANDVSPSGSTLTVAADLAQKPEAGTAFVADNQVRYQAPADATTVHLIYTVTDAAHQSASAQVTITVRAKDANDSPPVPLPVTARAIAGQTIRIPITLDGIDPDGDSVQLVGLGSAPTKGRVVTVGESWLDYEASKDASGTDEFTYQVADRLGMPATASVQVGIAPAAGTDQPPVAVPDQVTARPNRSLAVPVLVNDVDPDGDALTLVPGSLEVSDSSVHATVSGDRVDLTTPDHAETLTVYYGVTDGRTGTVTGSLTVTVDPNAPLLPPQANDDLVAAAAVDGKTSTTVDVLANDEDPDGNTGDLKVSCTVPGVTVNANGSLTIPVTTTAQSVLYTVTDVDGLTGSAFVWVPGSDALRPRLKSTTPVTVDSGAKVTLKLADYVVVAAGKTARVTTAASVSALHGNGDPVLVDATTLAFTSANRYYGAAAVTFGVTDGTGPDDPAGHTAVLTIPITVRPPANQPPTFTGSTVKIAPGEKATQVDLAALTTDPDEGDLAKMTYTLDFTPGSGITASVSGQTLSVAAGEQVPKGTTVTIKLKVSDGTSAPVDGTETVQVVASTRPLAVANDDVVDKAKQGQPVTVDVLANDQNPFPDTPLTLVGAPVVETGSGTATLNDTKVVVTPAADFVGTLVVRYRVQDATKDVDRQVDGRIKLTVEGKPARPGTPTVSDVRSKTVVLTWAAPANNGAQITSYTVTSNDGRTFSCPTTTCTLDGLTNNQNYTFTVVATNEVGPSDPSPASAQVRPDQQPSVPNAPTLTFGDKQLQVTWTAPTGYEGSPVKSYNLQISPPPGSGVAQVTGVQGTSYTWTGLDNGTAYKVQVQAVNDAPSPSDWSAWSAAEIPAGVPDAPGQPTTSSLSPVGSQAQMQVTWTAPNNNGDAIKSYTLHTLRGGTEVSSLPNLTALTQAVTLDTSESDYTFTVTATNKAGTSAPGPASAARRAFVNPGAVTGLTATPGDQQVTLSFGAAPGNGASASEISYQYQIVNGGGINGSSWIAMPPNRVVGNLQNKNSYTFAVHAVSNVEGTTNQGPAVSSGQVVPFGKPLISFANQTSGIHGRIAWTVDGNGRDLTSGNVSGGCSQSVGAGAVASNTCGWDAPSTSKSITVLACNAAGCTTSASASYATADSTLGLSTVSEIASPCKANNPNCVRLVVTGRNFPPNTSIPVTYWTDCGPTSAPDYPYCDSDGKGAGDYITVSITSDGDGNFTQQDRHFGYRSCNIYVRVGDLHSNTITTGNQNY